MASRRVLGTKDSPIVRLAALLQRKPGVLSLAQGIVHWEPPFSAASSVVKPGDHSYGPVMGMPLLVDAIKNKLVVNSLDARGPGSDPDRDELSSWQISKSRPPRVCISCGANAAFNTTILAVTDPGDRVLLFSPYYFNHEMALTLNALQPVFVPRQPPRFRVDFDLVEAELKQGNVRCVVLVNPCNPCGVTHPRRDMARLAALCAQHKATLVCDLTYQEFVYQTDASEPGQLRSRIEPIWADNVINIFSFSKAYGMMGWRVGYMAWTNPNLDAQFAKIIDTIHICPTQASQRLALHAINAEPSWVAAHVASLTASQTLVRNALSRAGAGPERIFGGEGAIYYLVNLLGTRCEDDWSLCEKLIADFGVGVVPGSAFGQPGTLRVCYANLPVEQTREAACRLEEGLKRGRVFV